MDHSAVTSPPSGITTDPFQIVPPQEFRPAPPRPTLDPRHRTRDRATLRIARWSATHPWRSVSAWILLVVFGALLAAGVPVLLGLSAVAAASGLSALVSQLVPSTGSTSAMILLMGMAVGVDYSLFYVKRYREERARNQEHLDAVQIAAETSGHSVQVSGLAVIISMASLFIVGDVTFASLGAGSILVVAIAVLGSLTVLPALLAGLGRAMDRPRVPLVWRLAASTRAPRGGRPNPCTQRSWAEDPIHHLPPAENSVDLGCARCGCRGGTAKSGRRPRHHLGARGAVREWTPAARRPQPGDRGHRGWGMGTPRR